LVLHPERHRFTMPPWLGSKEEADVLTLYLRSIAPDRPPGMAPSSDRQRSDSPGGGMGTDDSGSGE
jgi:hypothetical protein